MASMIEGARKVVRVCARVRAGEAVAIVADTAALPAAEALMGAALEITDQVATVVTVPRRHDGEEPPRPVAPILRGVDVALLPLSYSISHSEAVRNALMSGTRVLSLPGTVGPHQLTRDGADVDVEEQVQIVRRMAQLLSDASEAHLVTPAGTDCRFSLEGREGNAHDCILDRPGKFSAFPGIEANIAPLEGSAEGTIVFDGSIPNLRLGGPLRSPVVCRVSEGSVVEVSGGREADMIRRIWKSLGDGAVYNIAQLAVGLNPSIRILKGVWADHGAFGTVHIGIGTSANLGGTTRAAAHFDGMMYEPTLRLDGRLILEMGELRIPEAVVRGLG